MLIQEHHYYVLENNGRPLEKKCEPIAPDPDAPELPPPYKPDPSLLYHDINELSTRRAVVTEENEYASVTPQADRAK